MAQMQIRLHSSERLKTFAAAKEGQAPAQCGTYIKADTMCQMWADSSYGSNPKAAHPLKKRRRHRGGLRTYPGCACEPP
eukprot:15484902-Alexandrium_andersonii.AAC.1